MWNKTLMCGRRCLDPLLSKPLKHPVWLEICREPKPFLFISWGCCWKMFTFALNRFIWHTPREETGIFLNVIKNLSWSAVFFLFLKVLCFIHSHVMFSHGLRVALSVLRGRFIANHWPSPAVPSQRSGHIYTFICPSMLYTAKYNAHWGLQMMSYVMKEAGTPLLLYEADNRPAVFSQISVWGTWTVNKCLAYIYKWDVDTSSHMTFVFVFLNYLLLALQLSPYQQRHVTVLHQVVVQSPLTTVNGFQLEPNNLYL